MGQVLRITVGSADYSFKLLDWSKNELKVEIDGQPVQLKREGLSWMANASGSLTPQLAESIGKAVALRYRI
jgi:hypothetical protein